MPIRETTSIPEIDAVQGTQYLVFYASRDESGIMWCPDCRDVEEQVTSSFGPEGPSALIVYVGQKPEWKTPSNPARISSWKVDSVPTIIKLSKEGHEVSRLRENEVASGLSHMMKGTDA